MAQIETTYAKGDELYNVKIPVKEADKKVGEKIIAALRKLANRYDRPD